MRDKVYVFLFLSFRGCVGVFMVCLYIIRSRGLSDIMPQRGG